MDVACLGPGQSRAVLVLTSGTHGVEGFCGSGCQVSLLEDSRFLRQIERAGIALLMIHAVNPYGFSHLRRVNEDNVDLNRNFIPFDRDCRSTKTTRDCIAAAPGRWPPSFAQQGVARRVDRRARRQGLPGRGQRRPVSVRRRHVLRRSTRRRGAMSQLRSVLRDHVRERPSTRLDRLPHRPRPSRPWREDPCGPRRCIGLRSRVPVVGRGDVAARRQLDLGARDRCCLRRRLRRVPAVPSRP